MTSLLIRLPSMLALVPLLLACGEDSGGTGQTSGGATSGGNGNGSGASSGGTVSTSAGTGTGTGGGSAGSTAGSSSNASGSSSGGSAGASTTGGGNGGGSSGSGGSSGTPSTEKFSFFVTSLKAMIELSGSDNGFGGDLRFGETGAGAGLRGADKICKTIAEKSMPGNGKTWRAFLSATKGEDGNPVNAMDRVGEGPWYDRIGRVVAMNKTALINVRPEGADEAILNDLPNEDGVPNHEPEPGTGEVDNHDILTGTNEQGKLFSTDASYTCDDWTSSAEAGRPRCGHSWPRMGGPGGGGFPGGGLDNWMSALNEAGCAPGVWIIEAGPPGANGTKSVGDGGGYGGIYCFALTP